MVNFDLEARIDTATLFKHLEHRLKGFSPDTIGPANNSCRVKGTPADVDANSGKVAVSYDGSSGKAYFREYSRQLQTLLEKKKGLYSPPWMSPWYLSMLRLVCSRLISLSIFISYISPPGTPRAHTSAG